MATSVLMKHSPSGLVRHGYYGFSWTYLFFGGFVPLFRGEIGIGVLHLLVGIFSIGFWNLIVAFLFNKQYTRRMLERGYVLADTDDKMAKARVKLGISLPA